MLKVTAPSAILDSEGFQNWFAAVDFFSKDAAEKARIFSHENLVINGRLCKVLESRREARTDLPLALNKCEDLANFYLGFNGWNSKVGRLKSHAL